jgi:hypothetical protein
VVNDSDGVRLGSVREWEGVGKRTVTWGTDRAVSDEEAKQSKANGSPVVPTYC